MTLEKNSSLSGIYSRYSAEVTEIAGWRIAEYFGSSEKEIEHLRNQCVLVDWSHIGKISLSRGNATNVAEKAIKGAKFNLAFYGSTPAYKVTLDVHDWGDLQPILNRLTKEGRWDEISSVITDEVLHTLAVVGEPSEVGSQLVERFGDIADRVGLSVPYDAPVDLLADVVSHVKLNSAKKQKN